VEMCYTKPPLAVALRTWIRPPFYHQFLKINSQSDKLMSLGWVHDVKKYRDFSSICYKSYVVFLSLNVLLWRAESCLVMAHVVAKIFIQFRWLLCSWAIIKWITLN
jgi:hypothetical protein